VRRILTFNESKEDDFILSEIIDSDNTQVVMSDKYSNKNLTDVICIEQPLISPYFYTRSYDIQYSSFDEDDMLMLATAIKRLKQKGCEVQTRYQEIQAGVIKRIEVSVKGDFVDKQNPNYLSELLIYKKNKFHIDISNNATFIEAKNLRKIVDDNIKNFLDSKFKINEDPNIFIVEECRGIMYEKTYKTELDEDLLIKIDFEDGEPHFIQVGNGNILDNLYLSLYLS